MRAQFIAFAFVLCGCFCFAACPSPANNGDSGNGAAAGVTDQTAKFEVPNKIKKHFDFPAEFTIIELDETRTTVRLVYVVNPPRTQEIAQMIIADLETRGYQSGDNPSRILEGVTFTGGEFREVYVKVTEEYDKGTIVTLDVKI